MSGRSSQSVGKFNRNAINEKPAIVDCPNGHLESKPYKRACSAFGVIISSVIDEFKVMGQYSVTRGLRHENPGLNTEVGLHFLNRVFGRALTLEFAGVYVYCKVIGRNTSTKKKMEAYRKGGFNVPFTSATTALKVLRAKLNNGSELAVFLMIGKVGMHWEKKDYHCSVGVIKNGTKREFYYFNPAVKQNNYGAPGDLIYVRDEFGSGEEIMMGYGTESNNTADSIERALHFMGVVAENGDWKGESPNGWTPFLKYN